MYTKLYNVVNVYNVVEYSIYLSLGGNKCGGCQQHIVSCVFELTVSTW